MQPHPTPSDPAAIRFEAVRDLLRAMARERSPRHGPVAECAFVRRSLERAGFAATPAASSYELGRLIGEIVEVELGRLRGRAGIAPPAIREMGTGSLQIDFDQNHAELEAWSILYHLCLRPDLDLDLQSLTYVLTDRHRRTLQRRLQRGIQALTARLRELEHEALMAERRDQLWMALPPASASQLLGVDDLLDLAAEHLASAGGSLALVLAGPPGIGKTALARALAERSMLEGRVARLIWMQAEEAGPAPWEALCRDLSIGTGLLVIDGADRPELAAMAVRARAQLPPRIRILITGRAGWSAWPALRLIQLPPLGPVEALALLRREARARAIGGLAGPPDDALQALVAATSGHPAAILAALAQLRSADPARVAVDFATGRGAAAGFFRQLWAPAWQSASEDVRRLVEAAVALRRLGKTPSSPALARRAGLDRARTELALTEAVDAGLLLRASAASGCRFVPPLFLQRYLVQLLPSQRAEPAVSKPSISVDSMSRAAEAAQSAD